MTFDALNLISMIGGVRAGFSGLEAGIEAITAARVLATESGTAVGTKLASGLIAGDGPGAALADFFGSNITFNTEHAAAHFAGTGLDQGAIESAIQQQIESQISVDIPTTVSRDFMGRINFQDQIIEYRGFGLPNGQINVGTYYIP
jgi:hypothetical protein